MMLAIECGDAGITVEHKRYLLKLNGISYRVKVSTDFEGNSFMFQNIKNEKNLMLVCIGVARARVYMWVVPNEVAWHNAKEQHPGDKMFNVNPRSIPMWLLGRGGEYSKGFSLLCRSLKQ